MWAGSCSSRITRVAGGGSGTRRAPRVPTTTRARPRAAANHAARRSAGPVPLSSRAASRRRAHRPALSESGAMTRAPPGASPTAAARRSSRAESIQSSGAGAALCPDTASGGGARTSARFERGGGGRSARSVEPHEDRLSSAIQRPSARPPADKMGAGSTAYWIGRKPAASPSRSATTRPTRVARPPRGARTRWPGFSCSESGTMYENGRSSGKSKATSAIM